MKVTREIAEDLLPLYVAGEVSPASRALVEEFLRSDPELAELARVLSDEDLGGLPPEHRLEPARVALARTRRLLRRRTTLLALALLFTTLPLSFAVVGGRLTFLLIRDVPALGSAFLAIAVALWIALVCVVRRLRVTGL